MEELYIEYKDGTRDWVDPILEKTISETQIIVHNGGYEYSFDLENIKFYEFREIKEDADE